jgi:hypothetical protein
LDLKIKLLPEDFAKRVMHILIGSEKAPEA